MISFEAKDVHVSLNQRPVLEGVDLELGEGEIVGLIGPNGAGKSTLIKSLMRMIKPQSGSVSFKGKRIENFDSKTFAVQVAYLPQGRSIHWPLSVERVVALGRTPHLMPWQGLTNRDYDSVRRAMVSTDVIHLADRRVNQLAGGERSLVLLARALAVEPAVILADEPVAGLDPNHELQVMELLKSLARQGCGVLVVLHNLALAARFCHRVYLLHRGKMVAAGSPQEVLSAENLKESYHIEAQYNREEGEFYVTPWRRL